MPLPLADATAEQISRTCGEDPSVICRELLEATGSELLAEVGGWLGGSGLEIVLILLGALVATKLGRRMIDRGLDAAAGERTQERMRAAREMTPAMLVETREHSIRTEQRFEALTTLLGSLLTAVIGILAVFLILGELGVDLAPLLAGAGVVGLAIGFGAQSVVRDFLAGIFILLEDQYGVGDFVDLGDPAIGRVESVSLMTTRLRGVDGTTWHVPNGEITRVGNMSQHWSRSLLDIEVSYGTDLAHAKRVIKRMADELAAEDPDVLAEPEVWGVEALGSSGILIRSVLKTAPAEQWRLARELRERIKVAFDEEGIEIPFPQQGVWIREAGGEGSG